MKENVEKRVPKGEVKFNLQLSEEQKLAKAQILDHAYSFVLGKAGSGKTLLGISIALSKFFKREINKIVITRPTVATENIGFLPGTVEDKMKPWLIPIIDNIVKVYDKGATVQKMLSDGNIEIVSLAHFRGRTFENAVCVVDEFQNLTTEQLAMCLGRLGKESIMIFCGDADQIDLRNREESAYSRIERLEKSSYVFVTHLQENYRHPAVKDVLNRFYKS